MYESARGGFEAALDDVTLVCRVQDGDLRSFEVLVDRYEPQVTGLCRRMLRDPSEAEDAAQETFTTAWRRLETLNEPATFRTWIFRLASNACIDLIRRRAARRTTTRDPEELSGLVGRGPTLEQQAEDSAAVRHLEAVLDALPPEQRLAWLLYEVQGESYAEIGDILQISEGSVRGRIHRARTNIVRGMEGWA